MRAVPAAWILALPWLTFGMMFGFVIVPLPQLLAQQGMPGDRVAVAVAFIMSPVVWSFVFAPFLDVRFSRRSYALLFGALAVAAPTYTVLHHASLVETDAVMIVASFSACMLGSAVGGWTGSLIPRGHDSWLGAWTTIYNIGGSGIGIMICGYVTQRFSPAPAAALVFTTLLAPLLVMPIIPATPPGETPASENFRHFFNEVTLLVRRPEVLVVLVLLALPSASFALTNVLGSWSDSFHASGPFVSLISGAGAMLGGIAGAAIIPLLARNVPLRPLYLSVGLVGAAFTLSLLLLPRVSATYGLAFIGENAMQAAGAAAGLAIIFQLIGADNPLAATTFALMTAAMNLPVDYMEFVDAWGYGWRGITGAFLADASISASACILLLLALRRRLFLPARSPSVAG